MTTLDLESPFLEAHTEERVLHVAIDRTDRRSAMMLDSTLGMTLGMDRGLRDAAIVAGGGAELDAVCFRGTGEWFCE